MVLQIFAFTDQPGCRLQWMLEEGMTEACEGQGNSNKYARAW